MRKLSPREFRVASAAWRQKSVAQLAEELGYEEEEIMKIIESLRRKGVVTVEDCGSDASGVLVESCG